MKNTANENLWKVFTDCLVLAKGKLKGKKTPEKRILETVVFLAQTIKTIDSVLITDDGVVISHHMIDLFKECLGKASAAGEYDPLADKTDHFKEAQEALLTAMLALAKARLKIKAAQEAEEKKEDPDIVPAWELMQLEDEEIREYFPEKMLAAAGC